MPFVAWLAARHADVRGGFSAWHVLTATTLESTEGTLLAQEADGAVQASGPHPNQDDYRFIAAVNLPRVTGLKLQVLPHVTHTGGGLARGKSGEFILTDVKVQVRRRGSSQLRDLAISSAVADVSKAQKDARSYGDIKGVLDDDPRNGWTTQGAPATTPHVAVFAFAEPVVLDADEELVFELRHRSTGGDANIGRFRVSASDQPGEAVRSLQPAPLEALAQASAGRPEDIAPDLRARLFEQFLEDHTPYRGPRGALDRARRQLAEVKRAAGRLNVMVLAERAMPRETFVLERGVWDKPGVRVTPDVPAAIAPWPDGEPRNRLGLARWIVSPENPLTARVVVNHFWQMLFGAGLCPHAGGLRPAGRAPCVSRTLGLAGRGVHGQRLGREASSDRDHDAARPTGRTPPPRPPRWRAIRTTGSWRGERVSDCRAGCCATRRSVRPDCSIPRSAARRCGLTSPRGFGRRCSWAASATNRARVPPNTGARCTRSGAAQSRRPFSSTPLSGASAKWARPAPIRRCRRSRCSTTRLTSKPPGPSPPTPCRPRPNRRRGCG